MNEDRDRALDRALGPGSSPADDELAVLAARASALKTELHTPAPNAARERALFVQGVGGRKSGFLPLRFMVPAALVVAALVAIAGFGRTALPGQTLYPVREALASVGLAKTAEEEIDRRLASAREHITDATTIGLGDPATAQAYVLGAIADLERARTLTDKLSQNARAARLETIGRLEERAVDLLVRINEGPDPEDEIRGEDNSGPGSGDDAGGDDNSGPGSGDDDDDSSGPGSGDDDGGDDNSGSGSGDDSGGDDNSGSGSGGDDDRDGDGDRSGSGGDSDDSSGSGSGGDDDDSGSGSGGGDSDDSSGSGSGSGDRSGSGGGDDDSSGSGGSGSGDDSDDD